MEFEIIPQMVIVFSTGIIILILGKNISKAKEAPDDFLFENKDEKKEKEKFLYLCKRLLKRVNKEKYQEKVGLFWLWFEKVLRKLRINFLRLDNKIVSTLDRVKEKNVENEAGLEKPEGDSDINNDVKTREEDMRADDKKIGESNNGKNAGDNFIPKTEENIPAASNNSDEKKDGEEKSQNDFKVDETDLENKNRKGKEKEYIDLILKNPTDIKLYWKLGIVYSRRKNYKDAISCFRQITKIDPSYTKAKKKIVDLMGRMKKKKNDDSQ